MNTTDPAATQFLTQHAKAVFPPLDAQGSPASVRIDTEITFRIGHGNQAAFRLVPKPRHAMLRVRADGTDGDAPTNVQMLDAQKNLCGLTTPIEPNVNHVLCLSYDVPLGESDATAAMYRTPEHGVGMRAHVGPQQAHGVLHYVIPTPPLGSFFRLDIDLVFADTDTTYRVFANSGPPKAQSEAHRFVGGFRLAWPRTDPLHPFFVVTPD